MPIGDRIKERRKEKGLTQSRLAELVGVSAQAISKWETDAGMPDISQIVPLSQALGMSADELLGNKDRRAECELRWQKTLRQYGDCSKEMLDFVNEALREFPKDKTFLYRRVCDEYFLSQKTTNNEEAERYLDLARGNAFCLVKAFPDFNAAIDMLVQILVAGGMRDEATAWAYKSTNKDILLKRCLTGEELRRHHQKLTDIKLREFLSEMIWNDLPSLNTAAQIIYTAIPDRNFLYYTDSLMMIEKYRAEYYIQNKDYDKAVIALHQAFEIAKKYDKAPGEYKFTSPIFDSLTYHKTADMPPLVKQLLINLDKNIFDVLKSRPDYQLLIDDMRKPFTNPVTNEVKEEIYASPVEFKGRVVHFSTNETDTCFSMNRFDYMIGVAKADMSSAQPNNNRQAVVLMTKGGKLYHTVIEDAVNNDAVQEKELLEQLISAEDTEIHKIICMWDDGCFDLPSYNFRLMICKLHNNNKNAEMLLSGSECFIKKTVAETLPKEKRKTL